MNLKLAALLLALTASLGCAATSHPTIAAPFGVARGAQSLEAVIDKPGPITVETVTSATWEVPLSGLINLDNPRAAELKDRTEPFALFVHLLRHPTQGTFLIDSGVERAFAAHPDDALIHGVLGSLAHVDTLKTQADLASILEREGRPVHAVLLTHLHLDHVLGLRLHASRGEPSCRQRSPGGGMRYLQRSPVCAVGALKHMPSRESFSVVVEGVRAFLRAYAPSPAARRR